MTIYDTKKDEKKLQVYDLEQLINFHSYYGIDPITKKETCFVIHPSRNDFDEYYEFLTNRKKLTGMVGFNNLSYDYSLIHEILTNPDIKANRSDPDQINLILYKVSQKAISSQFPLVPQWEQLIPQLDLYKIHHFDNKNKRVSLKSLQVFMKFDNVEDLEIDWNKPVKEYEIPIILKYNRNDVISTYQFYLQSEEEIELRKKLGNKYGINILNANDPKIGAEVIAKKLSDYSGEEVYLIKQKRTDRTSIDLNSVILPSINFKTDEFRKILTQYKRTTIVNTKNDFQIEKDIHGVHHSFGLGGLHACVPSGIYDADDEYDLIDIDVASYYPNLAIVNGFYPEHLGEFFCKIYYDIYVDRKIAKKAGDKTTNAGLKLALNGVYGKSKDEYSYLYDPKYTMQITINGQLLLAMLEERILLKLPEAKLIQANTDGLTFKVLKRDREKLIDICKNWEKYTGLELEYEDYRRMVIAHVNAYIGIYKDESKKPKFKGDLEIDKEVGGKPAYHKDPSRRIVSIAVANYYVNDIPIEKTIREPHIYSKDFYEVDIYDYCLRYRGNKTWHPHMKGIENGEFFTKKLPKTVRYLITTDNYCFLYKEHTEKHNKIDITKHNTKVLNYLKPSKIEDDLEKYSVDFNYYIKEANKRIEWVKSSKTSKKSKSKAVHYTQHKLFN